MTSTNKIFFQPREAEKGFGDEIPKRVWDRSLPPPVAEAGRRSVGNRKERQYAASMRVPRVTMKPTLNCPGANTKENYLLSVVPLSQTITFTYFTLPLQETNPQPVYAGALSETI